MCIRDRSNWLPLPPLNQPVDTDAFCRKPFLYGVSFSSRSNSRDKRFCAVTSVCETIRKGSSDSDAGSSAVAELASSSSRRVFKIRFKGDSRRNRIGIAQKPRSRQAQRPAQFTLRNFENPASLKTPAKRWFTARGRICVSDPHSNRLLLPQSGSDRAIRDFPTT